MYRIEHADGLKSTLLLASELVRDFTVAIRLKQQAEPLSTQMYLPGLNPGQTLPNFFSALAHHIETLFLTGKPPYPVERTLMTTGIVAAAVDSLTQGQKRLETPHLKQVTYVAPRTRCSPGAEMMKARSRQGTDKAGLPTASNPAARSWRSSRRSGNTCRMPSTWATGTSSAIPGRGGGITRR